MSSLADPDPGVDHQKPGSCGGFFSGERFKKHEIDHRFDGHFRIFYCVGGHLNGHFLGFFQTLATEKSATDP